MVRFGLTRPTKGEVREVDCGRRKAAAGAASAALVAAMLGAPMAGLAQDPAATTPASAPEPAPTETTTTPEPATTVPDVEPAPTATEPASIPPGEPPAAPAAPPPATPRPSSNPPPLFMPDLPRTSIHPLAPSVLDPGAADEQARRRENALGTNREPALGAPADTDGAAGIDLGALLPATGAADVPSFFIDSFAIPPFLLPIYQAAAIEYGVPWEVLAAINAIETDFGRNLAVSSAGAVGWMQFLPSTFAQFGIDGSADGRADPYNPVDAIFSAASYLNAAGAGQDLGAALFAYNHSQSYVESVLSGARLLGGLPSDLVDALSGLAQGRPPVAGPAEPLAGEPATTLRLRTRRAADVVAVADGVVVRIGSTSRLGRYLQLRDVFGNTYTYGALGRLARRYRLPGDRLPAAPVAAPALPASVAGPALASTDWKAIAERMAAPAPAPARAAAPGYRPLKVGSRVIAGTTLARAGDETATTGIVAFQIRPEGRGAPEIQPRPFVEGWELLRRSAPDASALRGAAPAGIGRVLLLDKRELQREVLRDDRIAIYPCGRQDIRAGLVDRRVLATLKFLALSGLRPTVSSLRCGHGLLTAAGESSEHRAGAAVDIVAINGRPIAGNQGPGSIAEVTVRRLLQLQGALRPQQIISLYAIPGANRTIAMPDHADHIHVGFAAAGATTLKARNSDGVVPASSWRRLSQRLSAIANPAVAEAPSPDARAVTTGP